MSWLSGEQFLDEELRKLIRRALEPSCKTAQELSISGTALKKTSPAEFGFRRAREITADMQRADRRPIGRLPLRRVTLLQPAPLSSCRR